MEFPTVINGTSPFPFYGFLGGSFHFYINFDKTFYKQEKSGDLDRTSRSVASLLDLHCLPMSHKKDAKLNP